MGTSSAELLIPLDRTRPRGLRSQIEAHLRDAIRAGRLAPGTALPSTRALAGDLGITRGVVVDAYDQLIAEGYLLARPGSKTVVNRTPTDNLHAARAAPADVVIDVDFRPGLPDLDLFPRGAWSRATRTALQTMPSTDLTYGNVEGLPVLRRALADYLARVRGVSADPGRVVVCDSFGHGFHLVVRALRAAGVEPVGVEDPGYEGLRDGLAAMGVRCRSIEVDGDGLRVDQLRRSGVRAVVVTPAHQSPTGVVLSAARRRELVDWARDVDGYVIEDDYDAEYRYDRRPVGAMQGIAPERVIYAGTASKSLAPALRIGWLVAPPELVAPIVDGRRATDGGTSAILQATYAAFLANGDLDRHLRRTRRVYRERRDALVEALGRHLPTASVSGVAAGLHVLVTLPDGADEDDVVARALAAGVRVFSLSTYRARRRRDGVGPPPGLVMGYGQVGLAGIEHGVRVLAETVHTSLGAGGQGPPRGAPMPTDGA